MPRKRKGETLEEYRARDAARKRLERAEATLNLKLPPPGGRTRPNAPDELTLRPVNGLDPIIRLHNLLDRVLQRKRRPEARDLYYYARAFREHAQGLRALQHLATHDEVQRIVELVDPHLPEPVRERLQTILDDIDRRAGATS